VEKNVINRRSLKWISRAELGDQFKTTGHQKRRRWETIKARRLQVQIEALLWTNGAIFICILSSSREAE